jgi:aspartate/methionine/tyrosine aminotransferase
VYEALSFGQKHVSVLEIESLRDRSIVFGSFSKSYAMTGWRIGYAVAPDYVIRTMVHINESICFSAPSISQRAAIVAIKHRALVQPKLVRAFQERMNYGYTRINAIEGLQVMLPKGGIYLFVDIRKTGLGSDDFIQRLLDEKKVLALPGNVFGKQGEGFIRIAATVDLKKLEEAFDRIDFETLSNKIVRKEQESFMKVPNIGRKLLAITALHANDIILDCRKDCCYIGVVRGNLTNTVIRNR